MPGIGLPYSTQSHISCPEAKGRSLGDPLDADILQSRLGQPLAQDGRVGHLELEGWRIVREARKVESDGLKCADEGLEEFELRGEVARHVDRLRVACEQLHMVGLDQQVDDEGASGLPLALQAGQQCVKSGSDLSR